MTKLFFAIRKLLLEKKWYTRPIQPLLHLLYRLIALTYGAAVPLSTEIKGHPILIHGLHGIFLSKNAVIGKNVTIYHQVTIGSISHGSKSGAPYIGDNVLIGPGAKILGSVTIGNGAKIAANCVVVDDIPENALVIVPKPSVIIKSEQK
jgi:serine O-acetyltransferase